IQGKADIFEQILSAIHAVKDQISREQSYIRLLTDPSSLNPENVPFIANRAKVTPESLKQAEKQFCTTTIETPFELELYQRLENLKKLANETLEFAREKIYCDNINVFFDESHETGELEIK